MLPPLRFSLQSMIRSSVAPSSTSLRETKTCPSQSRGAPIHQSIELQVACNLMPQ